MKKHLPYFMLTALLMCSLMASAQDLNSEGLRTTVVKNSIGFGTVMAVVTSWSRNKSILWAILHGLFSWTYVGYFVITRTPEERR